MCGIAGIMMRDGRRPDPAILDRLQAAIGHRGPDSKGRLIHDATGLVCTRLAIVDLATGDQPLRRPDGTALIANGEIYNAVELRPELSPARFQTRSDCEPPLHLYARDGVAFADALRGMYAIAIHDPAEARLVLARDPFGIKPLYYAERDGCLAFASEAQALIKAGLVTAAVDPARRAELLQLKFTTGTDTILSGIRRVLPGETVTVVDGRIAEHLRRPALPSQGPNRWRGDGATLKMLDEILCDSVSVHLRSDVPYGLFLSGGIDSSALLALMKRVSNGATQTLTVGFADTHGADERREAERLARSIGSRHHAIEMSERDFWSLAPRVAAALDDPTADAATLPTYMLGQAARDDHLKVVLSGEGADELFAGYSRYRRARWPWRLITRKARSRGVFDAFGAMDGAMAGWRDGMSLAEGREASGLRTRLQELQAVDCAEWLPNDLLTKLDRCLMAHGVEGRTPFIDPAVAAFVFRLPDSRKVGARLGKRLLREWLSKALPEAKAFARKTGFNPPVGRWIDARKAEISRLVAAQPGIAEMLSPQQVEAVLLTPEKDSQAAWSLLFYALWHSHHVMGLASEGDVGDVLAEAARG